VVAPTGGWKASRYANAKLTFAPGTEDAVTVVVSGPAADVAAGADATLTWTDALAVVPAAEEKFDVYYDETTWVLGFNNPHYLGAAGILFGSEVGAMAQYAGKEYHGRAVMFDSPHGSKHGASCVGCHDPITTGHTFAVTAADLVAKVVATDGTVTVAGGKCGQCHTGKYGPTLPVMKTSVDTAAAELYTAIQAYANDAVTAQEPGATAVCYDGAAHPYWFVDANGDGACDATETTGAKFNANAAKAAFNFKWAHAEPGAFAHNYEYIMQALFDSIEDLGATPTFERP
jgi:hypothetical protein